MLEEFDDSAASLQMLGFVEEKCQAGILVWNLRNQEMKWSKGMFRLLGIPECTVEPTIDLFCAFMHPEDRLTVEEIDSSIKDGLPFQREFRIIQQDGRMRWMSARCEFLLDSLGTAAKLIGVATDVTDRHEMIQGLQAPLARFQKAVLGAAPIVWMAWPDGFIYETVGWQNRTGRPERSALGMDWVDALHCDDQDAAANSWRAGVETRRPFECEYRLAQAAGGYRWVRSSGAPAFAKSGELSEWTGIVVDISDQRPADGPGNCKLATGAQIRAARAILKWSVSALSGRSGITPAVIRRIEGFDGAPRKSTASLVAIGRAMVNAGVEFIVTPNAPPSVRLAHLAREVAPRVPVRTPVDSPNPAKNRMNRGPPNGTAVAGGGALL